MLIAVLSDIHANAAALSAALSDAKASGARELFLLGDYVGYYYEPREIFALLAPWQTVRLRGNHEELLAASRSDEKLARELKKKYGSGHETALRELPPAVVDELASLPASKIVERDGLKIELCHGSPWSVDAYVYPDAPEDVMEKCAGSGADFVLMGHTHRAFSKIIGRTLVANIGSVGQARDAGGAASWGLLDTKAKVLKQIRSMYDPSKLAEEAARRDPDNPYLRDVLFRKAA